MTVAFLVTSDLDLALTKVAEGRPVLYCGPHQGVFRFESVKAVALRCFRASSRPACVLGLPEGEEAAFRKFLAGV
jgi:hypothetical protein